MGIQLNGNCRLYVGNIPFEADDGQRLSESHLQGYFERFGRIMDVILMREPSSKRLRGFGFVEFSNHSEAEAALKDPRPEFHGRRLLIQIASPRRTNRSEGDAISRTA